MGNTFVKTPHLDELATQGILFTNAIAATPQCTAYRASLLTGRYGHNTGIVSNDLKLPHEEVTFAEILKQHGYATGFIGKWHLNSGRRQPNVPPALDDRARTELAQYYGLVSSLDENIGRLSRALHELDLAENTIVIFSSDHGDKVHTGGQPVTKRKPRNQTPSRKVTAEERARSIISSRDKDGDGMLTYDEFNRGFTGEAAQEKLQRFTEADTNRDKLMTVEEFTVVLQKLGRRNTSGPQ